MPASVGEAFKRKTSLPSRSFDLKHSFTLGCDKGCRNP